MTGTYWFYKVAQVYWFFPVQPKITSDNNATVPGLSWMLSQNQWKSYQMDGKSYMLTDFPHGWKELGNSVGFLQHCRNLLPLCSDPDEPPGQLLEVTTAKSRYLTLVKPGEIIGGEVRVITYEDLFRG